MVSSSHTVISNYDSPINHRSAHRSAPPITRIHFCVTYNLLATMKVSFSFLVVLAMASFAMSAPVTVKGDEEVYSRREDSAKIQQDLVQYFTDPKIYPKLPAGFKPQVDEYIRKYPEYYHKSSETSATKSNKSNQMCKNQ